MSWAETLLDASFRGVPIQVVSENLQWQRALSEHGTPFKDGDSVVDLGRGARRLPMQIIVYGVNYEIELQNLLAALGQRGPGELIQITVLGQHGQYTNDGLDTKRSHLRSQVQDETLARRGIFRPKVVVDSSSESQDMATTRARKLLADSRLEGFEIRAVVKGHRADNGQVWTPGQRVYVRSEPHGLHDIYFLMSRTLRLARGEGAITELRLREDKMWVLDGNKVKKHKGKSNPDAAFIQMIKGL